MKFVIRQALLVAALLPVAVFAGVDKVYDPYVEQGELEVELRGVHEFDDVDEHKVKLGVGYGVNARWFVEGYAVAEKVTGESAEVEEVELESKFQLTEKGQYWADLGLLVELEKELENDLWELKVGPIAQKQFNKWVATANLLFEKQFGNDKTEDEIEVLGRAQLKYRMSATLEPGVEYYRDEHTNALGPVLLGKTRWNGTPVKWAAGVFAGLNDDTADVIARWELEWEF